MKRTGFKRAAIPPNTDKLSVKPKRKCAACGERFIATNGFISWCSIDCGVIVALDRLAKQKAKKKRAERAEDKKRKDANKSRSDWIVDAQKSFNAFIRARDAGKPCICCGKPFEPQKPGGSMDAGHFRSRGSSPHLRFDERNCHGQRKNCNRPGGAKYAPFREGMIARIGIDALEALEADQTPAHWTIEELKQIIVTYKLKLKGLKCGDST